MLEQISLKSRKREATRVMAAAPPVWPMPVLNGRSPVVIAPNPKGHGIDLAYQRANSTDLLQTYPVGTANGTARHFMPNMMPAFAVRDGVITYAGKQAYGYAVIVDHRNGWATYYANLEFMFATPTEQRRSSARVKAGDVLGYVGAPAPNELKRLHFQLWKRDVECHFVPVDAISEMSGWLLTPWADARLTPAENDDTAKAA